MRWDSLFLINKQTNKKTTKKSCVHEEDILINQKNLFGSLKSDNAASRNRAYRDYLKTNMLLGGQL